ncbi:MAG: hypothetical protein MUC87_09330 [Bacteroidia bacterium]|jgi:hypothetical protein|nr:hypothetical protein [Bacteroidia bacterium]
MKTHIENGKGIIDILSDGFVTCLKVRKPIAADWYDCAGSAGKYFACTANYEPLAKEFGATLINGTDEEIEYAVLNFMNLFSSGEYLVFIDRNKRTDIELHYQYFPSENPGNFKYNYYNPMGDNLMFTQSAEHIKPSRVKHYENLIERGLRPKAVVFQAVFNEYGTYKDGSEWMRTTESPMFILDGHHKLLAYQNLNVDPEFVLISKERNGEEEFPKHKSSLYFEYEYFLTDPLKQHIICNSPQLLLGHTSYNEQFDRYLKTTPRVTTVVIELFQNAGLSKNKSLLVWLLDRIEALESRNFETNKMGLYFRTRTAQYSGEIWKSMEINSKSDFYDWVLKTFNKTIEELKKV